MTDSKPRLTNRRKALRDLTGIGAIAGMLPLLGRFFRSKAESAQKRNLLIFVTANLVSPGGSPLRRASPVADR